MKKIYFSFLLCAGLISVGQWSIAQNQKSSSAEEQTIIEKMKSDGATAQQIEIFLQSSPQRIRPLADRQNPVSIQKGTAVTNASCADGFETADFTGWNGELGCHPNYPCPWTPGFMLGPPNPPGRHAIVPYTSYSIDPCSDPINSPIPLPAPNFGGYSAMLGNNNIGGEAEKLLYPFVVNPTDTNYLFSYAIVMQDPGHAPADQPFFNIYMLDANGDTIPNSFFYYVSGPNLPGFYNSVNCVGTIYKPWTLRGVNLSPYIGQQITLVVINSDCALSGHFGYGYVDMDCDGNLISPRYCSSEPVTLNARSEPNSQYLWEDGSTTEAITITNPTAGDTISCWVTPWGGYTFRANYVLSPAQVNFSYLVNGSTINFTDLSSGAVSYNWDFGDGNFSTLQNPSHTYTANGTYTVCLTIIASAGCNVTYCDVLTLTTGISETEIQNSISLIPNPASDFVSLEFGNSYVPGKILVEVYNLVGEKINSGTILPQNGKYYLNVSALPHGIYFAKITANKGTVTKSLAVMHK